MSAVRFNRRRTPGIGMNDIHDMVRLWRGIFTNWFSLGFGDMASNTTRTDVCRILADIAELIVQFDRSLKTSCSRVSESSVPGFSVRQIRNFCPFCYHTLQQPLILQDMF